MSFSTEAMEISVQSTRAGDDNELRPHFDAVGLPQRWDRWAKIMGSFALIIGLLWLVRRFRLAWKAAGDVRLRSFRETEAPQVWLKMRLERIHRLLNDGHPDKEIWTELAHAVRGYFARCSMNPVEAWTTGEFELRLTRYPEARRLLPLLEIWDSRFSNETKKTELSPREALQRTERILLPWAS